MENLPKISILYAEDNDNAAKLTKAILNLHGYSVEIAPDGEKAWKAYKSMQPNILLLDLDLPGINGVELTRLIRGKDTETHIIIYTSHAEEQQELAALDAGADEFFGKDKKPEMLVYHLNRLRDRIIKNIQTSHLYILSPDTSYNSIARLLTIRGSQSQLSSVDGRFLHLLCAKNNEVADKEFLIQGIWGKSDLSKKSELKKYASRVRSYLKADPSLQIECRDGGYILLAVSQ